MVKQQDLFSPIEPEVLPKKAVDRLVPFGKYKDQPYEVLLTDADYSMWLISAMHAKLEQQFPALLAFLIGRFGNPENTPAHNRLQNRFLDESFAIRFALATRPYMAKGLLDRASIDVAEVWSSFVRNRFCAEADRVANRRRWEPESKLPALKDEALQQSARVWFEPETGTVTDGEWRNYVVVNGLQFEEKGADVIFAVSWSGSVHAGLESGAITLGTLSEGYPQRGFRVEVKPVVGDDYPAVLRAMKAVKCPYLLVGEYCGAGATWEEVSKVFSLSDMTAILLTDVEHQPLPPNLPIRDVDPARARQIVEVEFEQVSLKLRPE